MNRSPKVDAEPTAPNVEVEVEVEGLTSWRERLAKLPAKPRGERMNLVANAHRSKDQIAHWAAEDPDEVDAWEAELGVLIAKPEAKKLARKVRDARERLDDADRQAARAAAQQAAAQQAADNPAPPTNPHPLILRYAGSATMWVRTSEQRWVVVDDRTLRGELAGQWPTVPMQRVAADGKVIACSPAYLVELHGRRVDSIVYDNTIDRSMYAANADDLGGELILQCAQLDPAVKPERHVEVGVWLDRLGGTNRERFLDWLATAPRLKQPTAALYLHGPPSAGKGLLAAGLARLWGRQVTAYRNVVARFNSSMRDCPIILLDEGAPPDPSGSATFRTLVGEREHSIEDKGRPVATLRGCVRLVIAANNPDALRIREDLTPEDEAAIGRRVLMVHIAGEHDHGGPVAFLRSCAHQHWVEDEQGRPGPLVRHLAWLQATRQVKTGPRFLVEGDSAAWVRGAARRGGLRQEVLIAIARYALTPGSIAPHETPIWFGPNVANVSPDRLQTCWARIMPGAKVPTVTAIGRALAVFAPEEDETRQELPDGRRVRVRAIPAGVILEAAAAAGVGDDDQLRLVFT